MTRPIRHPRIHVQHDDVLAARRKPLDKPHITLMAFSDTGNTTYETDALTANDLVNLIKDAARALALLDAIDRRDLSSL